MQRFFEYQNAHSLGGWHAQVLLLLLLYDLRGGATSCSSQAEVCQAYLHVVSSVEGL